MTASSPSIPRSGAWSGPVLLALIVSEYRKAMSTAAWWALLLPAALISLLIGFIVAKTGGLSYTAPMALALALEIFGSKFAAIFGVVCASAEYQHRTITTSHLVSSGRPQLLVAKALFAAAVGAGYAVVCSLFAVLGILTGEPSSSEDLGNTVGVVVVAMVVFALWSVLGVGLGALLASQLGAIVGLLLYLLFVEGVLSFAAKLGGFDHFGDYLPGGAAAASLSTLASSSESGLGALFNTAEQLPWGISLIIFFVYTALIYAAGMAVAQARDIT